MVNMVVRKDHSPDDDLLFHFCRFEVDCIDLEITEHACWAVTF